MKFEMFAPLRRVTGSVDDEKLKVRVVRSFGQLGRASLRSLRRLPNPRSEGGHTREQSTSTTLGQHWPLRQRLEVRCATEESSVGHWGRSYRPDCRRRTGEERVELLRLHDDGHCPAVELVHSTSQQIYTSSGVLFC